MYIQHNYLKSYRKRSGLKQSDIIALLNLPNRSSLGLWERGKRKTSLDIPILYHVLFDIPIEHIFERQKHFVLRGLYERVDKRIDELKALPYEPQISLRIAFLFGILERLTPKSE